MYLNPKMVWTTGYMVRLSQKVRTLLERGLRREDSELKRHDYIINT
jgi:hypothetical protein